MPNYANGKIYKIVGEDGSTYYGSTTTSLKARMGQHPYNKETTAHQKIISQMDWEMVLVENYPCESKKELEDREGWYIRENPCVNRQVAGRTSRDWHREHSARDKVLAKKYYQENSEEIRAYNKIRDAWLYSFGDYRKTNCLQRCDYMLFQ
tara:strand:- start:33 stop:485 length:453 start_codon:yes stop_codon:yes gene_type:complete